MPTYRWGIRGNKKRSSNLCKVMQLVNDRAETKTRQSGSQDRLFACSPCCLLKGKCLQSLHEGPNCVRSWGCLCPPGLHIFCVQGQSVSTFFLPLPPLHLLKQGDRVPISPLSPAWLLAPQVSLHQSLLFWALCLCPSLLMPSVHAQSCTILCDPKDQAH